MRKILVYTIAMFGIAYGTSAQDQTINGTTFKQDGKVGVGTTSPTDKLQIYDDVDGAVYLGIYNNSTANNSAAGIKLGMGNQYDFGTYLYHRKYDNTFYFENIGAPSSKFAFVTRKSDGTSSASLKLNENGRLHQTGNIPNDNNAVFINTATSGYGIYSKGGLNNHYAFHFENQAGQSIMLGRGNGNIGIGTIDPMGKLQIQGGAGEQPQGQIHIVGNGEGGPGDAYISFHEGVEPNSKWSVGVKDNDNAFSISKGLTMDADPKFMIFEDTGNVAIGTSYTGSHKLAVEGSIGAREVKVEATGWSDFVFDENYDLPALHEVEIYIREMGHLQDVPSAKDVCENGINLGEMDAKLLQKIEELMLYTIQQQKEIQKLKTQNMKIQLLEKQIDYLMHSTKSKLKN